jgi:hypothetical protein
MTSMLDPADLAFFARNGYLHLRRVIEKDICEALIDLTWDRLPADWSRTDPESWRGMAPDSCHTNDLYQRRGLFQFKEGNLLHNPLIEGTFGTNAIGGTIAREIIGRPLAQMKIRGLYCIFPAAAGTPVPFFKKGHIESHPSQLISLCYLDDVLPGGGGLTIWPGSHRTLYPLLGSKLEHVSTLEYEDAFWEVSRLEPIEVAGERGDLVIIHHRTLHMASTNRSSRVRYGFLYDHRESDFLKLCSQQPGYLWEDWPAIDALPPEIRNAPCDFALGTQQASPKIHQASAARLKRHDDLDESSKRKGDASIFARMRQVDDLWLIVSDSPDACGDTEIFPRGGPLQSEGVRILFDGELQESMSQYDYIVRISPDHLPETIELIGLRKRSWLRILLVQLPFKNTKILGEFEMLPVGERTQIEVGLLLSPPKEPSDAVSSGRYGAHHD